MSNKFKLNTLYVFKWEYCSDLYFNVFYSQNDIDVHSECIGNNNGEDHAIDNSLTFNIRSAIKDLDYYTEIGPYTTTEDARSKYPELFV